MWNYECTVVPIVIGGLGALSDKFLHYLGMIPAEISADLCQKIAVLGCELIMRSCLSKKYKTTAHGCAVMAEYNGPC